MVPGVIKNNCVHCVFRSGMKTGATSIYLRTYLYMYTDCIYQTGTRPENCDAKKLASINLCVCARLCASATLAVVQKADGEHAISDIFL